MKILFDARTAIPRFPGIGRYAAELAPALAKIILQTGDELSIIANSASLKLLTASENIQGIPCDVPPDAPESYLMIQNLIAEIKPDVYHSPHRMCHPATDIATVLTVHDCIPVKCPFQTTPQERITFLTSVGNALRSCTRAITVSQTTLDDLNALFPGETDRCRVVHHGVDKHFSPTSAAQHDVVARTNKYPRPALLYIGSNLRHKNLVELFRGFARARPLLHGVNLVLGGFGCTPVSRHKRLIESLELNDYVTWVGEVTEKDLPAIIGSATAFVMPSLYEGFGLPALEALACGTPVACSDISALREVCEQAACYFDPTSPDAIAQALVSVISDDIVRSRIRQAGLERARNFTWQKAAQKTLDVYREAIESQSDS